MTKGNNTKEHIMLKAATIFANKGYAKVTMKDICDVSGLSRGGVYRYFSSTKEIFIELLNTDQESNSNAVEDTIKNNKSATLFLDEYLYKEKAAALSCCSGLYFAVHEFSFIEKDQRPYFDKITLEIRSSLSELLKYGQSTGEFKQFKVDVVSKHILHLWDSIKTSSSIMTITEEDLDEQIFFLKELILSKKKENHPNNINAV